MNLAEISIKRPVFITCIILLMLAVGGKAMTSLGVDLFPKITFPVIIVTTVYPGSGPAEVENLISKPLEEELSTLSGIKRLSSINQEGTSRIIAEFTLETDIKFAENQIRDRVSSTKSKLPNDIKEPVIRRIDPSDQPVLMLSVKGKLSTPELYDLAAETIRPRLEQVSQVGLVEVIGGRRREVRVELDRNKLKAREISASQVSARLASSGENIPAGKVNEGKTETILRTLGQFKTIKDIENTVINFFGGDIPVTLKDIGTVTDALEDETARTYVSGSPSLFIMAFRQSGANTVEVVDSLRARVAQLNTEFQNHPAKPQIEIVRDGSWWIRANITDVQESIMMGVLLAVIVVYFFLASGRSTIITGLALPNSLIGAFVLMAAAGFTINIMTLLALSLSVGLLVDDAIVVRENIFRYIEKGKDPITAAKEGTAEVRMAVIATTLTVIAVFGPVGFLKGVVGQFFKEFGLTICFAMAISLFDALTIAPMLSAYFAGSVEHRVRKGIWGNTVGRLVDQFGKFQDRLELQYERLLKFTLRRPILVLGASFVIFLGSCVSVKFVPKTFLPPQDAAEFSVNLDLPPGTSLDAMTDVALKVDEAVRKHPAVELTALTVGGREGDSNVAQIYVHLVPAKQRKQNTSEVKEDTRNVLKNFSYANPKVGDYDAVAGGQRPFNLNIVGQDQKALEEIALKVFDKLKTDPRLKDVDINYRPGKPEFQVIPNQARLRQLGISTALLGAELRTQVEGTLPAKFRENGLDYDVRVRFKEDQRNLRSNFSQIFIPNINGNLVRLSDVAQGVETVGPAKIYRQDRGRYLSIQADITPGAGMGDVMQDIAKMFDTEIKLPQGMRYMYIGQAENFKELGQNMAMALGFGVLFIFLVLASLYESFVTPLTIMLALPLALCGSFVALLVTGQSLNIFSQIGIIMLLGVAVKNSILLVDFAQQLVFQGRSRTDAMIESGKVRLRPILMTTMALIAGTIPIALGLNEASRQRTSMGVAIVGGLISSTLLTLVVIPAAYQFIDRYRIWSSSLLKRLFQAKPQVAK